MKTIKISRGFIKKVNAAPTVEFPKYTTQLMNVANQNSHATRPRNVGQLSDLFQQYVMETEHHSIEGWKQWYTDKYPNTMDEATQKIKVQVDNFKAAINLIDEDLIRLWVEDLIVTKTFHGLYVQKAIIQKVAELAETEYRASTPAEESKGIDGIIGGNPVSIKPTTYTYMKKLNEKIEVPIIQYEKSGDDYIVHVPDGVLPE
ncbi:MjaI family restriction endonuclease [Chungangia koreensis]|uniref:MjaI family restriction endonuclease n=1 Tax=Chungangia koreensis TaxID=752657 RepID=A0ABV8X786_9LACT